MESLGKFLKHGREEAGVTLEELSERTRIRRESLECLESEDLDNLPTDTYVRGFVKQVCRELGLHPREGLVRYETLRERLGPPDEMTWSEERAEVTQGRLQRALEDPERVMQRARRLVRAGLWTGGVLVVLAAGWGGLTLVRHFRDGSGESPRVASVAAEPGPEAPGRDANGAAEAAAGRTEDQEEAAPAGTPPAAAPTEAGRSGEQRNDGGELASAGNTAPTASGENPASRKAGPSRELPLPLEQVRVTVPNPAKVVPGEILVTIKPAESIREQEEAAKRRELAAAAIEEAAAAVEGDTPSAPAEDGSDAPAENSAAEKATRQEDTAGRLAAATEPETAAPPPARSVPETGSGRAAAEQAFPTPPPTQASAGAPSPSPALTNPTPRARRPLAGERLRLEIVALRAVDVQVLLDGIGYPRSTSMEAGDVKVWKADSLFVLHASDGGAVRIILSGEDLGVPGRDHERLERLVIRGDR